MSDEKWRWPKRIIPYTIGSEYTAARKKMIQGAMQEWMDKTCIVFAEKGSSKAREAGWWMQRYKLKLTFDTSFFFIEDKHFFCPGHDHAINIGSHIGCYSYVGYQGKDHPVSLQLGACTVHRIVLHELGHTIGERGRRGGNNCTSFEVGHLLNHISL